MSNSESEWLVQAQRGNNEAFASLVKLYQRPVYNLCYRLLGGAGEAEDAAQETFLRAYKNIRQYDSGQSFATWLLSIASHFCIDQLRRKRFSSFSMDDEDYAWQGPPDPGPSPEAIIGVREKQKQVQTLLGKLAPKDRAAVVMSYWYDFSCQEIARELSLTVSAVKSRLHRARRELAEMWQEQKGKTLSKGKFYDQRA